MKKSIIIPAILMGILLTGSIAAAKPFGYGSGQQCNGKGQVAMTAEQHAARVDAQLQRIDLILDLSDEQEKQLAELFNQRRQERQQLREERQAGRDERRAAMRNGELDEAQIRAQAAERAEQRADRMIERAKMKKQVYAILTPEQQQKAAQLWETRRVGGKRGGNGFCL